MSIYFVHFLSSILPLGVLVAFSTLKIKNIFKIFLSIFLGFLFAYFAFFIADKFLQTQNLIFNVNFLFIFCLILNFVFYFWQKIENLNLVFSAILSFCIALNYYFLSQDFPIFTSSLIDNQTFESLGFISLAFIVCLMVFFFLRWQKNFNKLSSFFLFFVIVVIELNTSLANVFLTLMRENLISTYDFLLSFVAKSLYFGIYDIYIYLLILIILAFLSLKMRVKNIKKSKILDINFRKNEAKTDLIFRYFIGIFSFCILSLCILLYFHIISLKPLKIDTPTEVLPNEEGKFVFDVEILRDNKLHRFAYISTEGKVIRFFLINKKEDRVLPVAVFDACMICGDMGYVKKDGELICISCNVRIFLASIGKAGGCNPIPLEYEFDGKNITIDLKDVVAGSNYFNEIKEMQVIDPVSKDRVINLKAPYSYNYQGITYYFVNQKNYEEFKKDPTQFINEEEETKFIIQRRNNAN